MSFVLDSITCPQCGYTRATVDLDCRTSEEETSCRRCGYHESWTAKYDRDGKPRGWTHEINRGFGALWYQGTIGFAVHYLNSAQEIADAEKWLSERLDKAEVEKDSSYLTHWNHETKQVELVIGKFYDGTESGDPA
jgi:predicted nucleic-acid-binding Zn-ribbon protein